MRFGGIVECSLGSFAREAAAWTILCSLGSFARATAAWPRNNEHC